MSVADVDDEFAEILASQHSSKCCRGVLQAIDDVFAIADFAPTDPYAHLAEEPVEWSQNSRTMNPRIVMLLLSAEASSDEASSDSGKVGAVAWRCSRPPSRTVVLARVHS
jgi:hypothetical protein